MYNMRIIIIHVYHNNIIIHLISQCICSLHVILQLSRLCHSNSDDLESIISKCCVKLRKIYPVSLLMLRPFCEVFSVWLALGTATVLNLRGYKMQTEAVYRKVAIPSGSGDGMSSLSILSLIKINWLYYLPWSSFAISA